MYDVIVVGGGPGGYISAIKAAQSGMKVALAEKERLGGVCLNKGCIPTKMLLHTASLYNSIIHAAQYGIRVSEAAVDFAAVSEKREQLVTQLGNGIQYLMKKNGINVLRGEASLLPGHQIMVNGNVMQGKNLIIAAGSSPVLLPIPGINGSNVLTSDDALMLKQLPGTMTIIGGGVIGVEMAVLFQSLGCKAAIIEMADRLVPMMDTDLSAGLMELLKDLGVKVITSARVMSVDMEGVTYHCGSICRMDSEKVLVAAGRYSNGRLLNLDEVGIRHNQGIIETDDLLRTNIPGVYAVGDVNGRMMLAHVAAAEGMCAAECISGIGRPVNYRAIPQCVYTSPEAAAVGMTEDEARRCGYGVKISRIPLAANGRALSEGYAKGFVKMISDTDTGCILGVHMLAPHAAEMVTQLTAAISLGIKAKDLAHVVFPHPTVSELIHEAIHGAVDRPLHL